MAHVPVVAVHGVGLDQTMWEPLQAAVAFDMHTYDMLGHGQAAKPAGPYSLEMFVSQLRDEIDRLAVDGPVDLIGFSMGALVAQSFAVTYPTLVRRLVLMNAVYERTEAERDAVVARVAEVRAGGFGASIDVALTRWFTPAFAEAHPEVITDVRAVLERNDVTAYANAYEVFATADASLVDKASGLTMPLLVMTGENDPRSTPLMSQTLAGRAPDAEAVILPGLRHLAVMEDPAAVAALVGEFCK